MAQLDEAEIRGRIKDARKEAGLSQVEMAELLGVIPRTVQNYENDHVPWARIRDIAEITGVATRWLLHGDEIGGTDQSADLLVALAQVNQKLDRLLGEDAPHLSPEEEVEGVIGEIESGSAEGAGGDQPSGAKPPRSGAASPATRRRPGASRRAR